MLTPGLVNVVGWSIPRVANARLISRPVTRVNVRSLDEPSTE